MPATPERRVEALAASQHGVVSRAQARRLGMSARTIVRRASTGSWVEVHPGVYRPAAVPRSWESDLMAALLWAGRGALVSHRSAGRLWGMGGLEDGPPEISVRTGRAHPGVLTHRLRSVDRPRIRRVGGFPVTVPERTILDLCGVLTRDRSAAALDDALNLRLTTLPRIQRALHRAGGPGRRGTATLRRLLEHRAGSRMESELERRFLRLIRTSGLPAPETQFDVRSRGRLVARLDFAYPDRKVGVETHGYRWHGDRERWARDIRRENRLKGLGWTVLVFTWDEVVSQPGHVIAQVRALLTSRGLFLPRAAYGA